MNWSRKEIKQTAKEALKRNYWKSVLAALILAIMVGGAGIGTNAGGLFSNSNQTAAEQAAAGYVSGDTYGAELAAAMENTSEEVQEGLAAALLFALALVGVVIVVAILLGIAIGTFISNPFEVGGARFFTRNLQERATLGNLLYCFKNHYLNGVKIMFLRDLFLLLWTCLLLVPGMIKAYEYRMIPYIVAEQPEISRREAFLLSKQMMDGNKWKAFIFDLSFFFWYFLGAITCGLAYVFYVNPYKCAADAALYQTLKGDAETVIYQEG